MCATGVISQVARLISEDGSAIWQGVTVPHKLLRKCLKENVAYHVEATLYVGGCGQHHLRTEDGGAGSIGVSSAPCGVWSDAGASADDSLFAAAAPPLASSVATGKGRNSKGSFAEVTPLYAFSEDAGMLVKVAEPNEESSSCRGPILWVGGLKMHVSLGTLDSRFFSKLLARNCLSGGWSGEASANGSLLDLFYGLGVTSGELFRLGAQKVWAFEKPSRVAIHELAAMLPTPSVLPVAVGDPRLKLQLCDLATMPPKMFELLEEEGCIFDGAVIDPPKREVMEVVYSTVFLDRLADFLKPGAVLACYAPDVSQRATSPRRAQSKLTSCRAPSRFNQLCKSWAQRFLPAFFESGRYQALPAHHVNIARFRCTR